MDLQQLILDLENNWGVRMVWWEKGRVHDFVATGEMASYSNNAETKRRQRRRDAKSGDLVMASEQWRGKSMVTGEQTTV